MTRMKADFPPVSASSAAVQRDDTATGRAVPSAAAAALGRAASLALPLVQERRGTELRDTKGVARRLTTAAIGLFADRGYDEVTIQDIADAAEVNKRTFFRYFPTKETVVLDIWDQTNATLVELIEHVAADDVLDGLSAAVVAWCQQHEELLVGLGAITVQSRTLAALTMLHSAEWEEHIAEALLRRWPDLDRDVAAVAGVITMGSLRVSSQRILETGRSLPVETAQVFAALKRALA
jgi:AcrR family transcriptional regulator